MHRVAQTSLLTHGNYASYECPTNRLTNKPTNQPTDQPTSQSTNQSRDKASYGGVLAHIKCNQECQDLDQFKHFCFHPAPLRALLVGPWPGSQIIILVSDKLSQISYRAARNNHFAFDIKNHGSCHF